ncbi:hypothetical protein Tco_1379437, partial [Tanacetum coccineum]
SGFYEMVMVVVGACREGSAVHWWRRLEKVVVGRKRPLCGDGTEPPKSMRRPCIAIAKDWPCYQLDVNNVFRHGYVEEESYMKPPEGYSNSLPGQHDYSIVVKSNGDTFTAVIVNVDDILITDN